MKKCAKIFFLLLLAGSVLTMGGTLVSCNSPKVIMNQTKKHSSRKVVKDNISVRGTNDRNGRTYRSY